MEGNVRQEGGRAPKKCHPHCPGQVDIIFWGGGELFILTCPMGKRSGKSSANKIIKTANKDLSRASKI